MFDLICCLGVFGVDIVLLVGFLDIVVAAAVCWLLGFVGVWVDVLLVFGLYVAFVGFGVLVIEVSAAGCVLWLLMVVAFVFWGCLAMVFVSGCWCFLVWLLLWLGAIVACFGFNFIVGFVIVVLRLRCCWLCFDFGLGSVLLLGDYRPSECDLGGF